MAIIWNLLILAQHCHYERIWTPCHWEKCLVTFLNGNYLKSAHFGASLPKLTPCHWENCLVTFLNCNYQKSAHFGSALPKWADLKTLPLSKVTWHFTQWQLFESAYFGTALPKWADLNILPLIKVTCHSSQWQLFEICSFWRSTAKMSGFEHLAIEKSDLTL